MDSPASTKLRLIVRRAGIQAGRGGLHIGRRRGEHVGQMARQCGSVQAGGGKPVDSLDALVRRDAQERPQAAIGREVAFSCVQNNDTHARLGEAGGQQQARQSAADNGGIPPTQTG